MAEFSPRVLDLLRQPMEDSSILISRAGIKVRFPTQFLLVGATNPCRCGKLLENPKLCTCNEWQRKQYLNRISGPLLDRIDLFSELYQIDKAALLESVQGTNLHLSDCLREQVAACWERQYIRCDEAGQTRVLNGSNRTHQIMEFFRVTSQSVDYAVQSSDKLRISARGLNRILRVARTIADLEGERDVLVNHVSEALQFRQKTL
jgi:magnesium chelatase family protein